MECKPHNITLKRTVAKLKQGSSRYLWIMDYALWLSTKLPLASWLTDLWFDKYEKINAYLRTLQRNMGKNQTDFIVSIGVLKKSVRKIKSTIYVPSYSFWVVLKVYLSHKQMTWLKLLKYMHFYKENKNCRMKNRDFFKVLFQHVLIFVCNVGPSRLGLGQLYFC